ncbi:MAG TPA: hypothetical protein PLM07_00320 [Candidatus Rifleibacterium sp.]|nr:hypothetical protein [Candidatus Rifleibacterium sp.]
MSRITSLVLLFCFILPVSMLAAAEVAMVTDKTGSVQASLAGDKWEVELAEILPDGVEIKVAPDGSLVLIHLPTNQEYRFSADATATISLAAVVGGNFTSSAVELVSSDLALGQNMANQTGAVNPERIVGASAAPPPPAPARQQELRPSISDEGLNKSAEIDEKIDKEIGMTPEIAVPQAPDEPIADAFETDKPSESESMPDNGAMTAGAAPSSSEAGSLKSEESDNAKAAPAPAVAPLCFAMPTEVFTGICDAESSFDVSGAGVSSFSLGSPVDGWCEFSVDYTGAATSTFNLGGNLASMTVAVVVTAEDSIVAAWKLEKSGYLYQAAAMWLNMQKNGLPAARVSLHLKRIKAAMLAPKN